MKSIPELQIELNDLKRKGCTPEELASWVHRLENPYEFQSNIVLFFTHKPIASFNLHIFRFFDRKTFGESIWFKANDDYIIKISLTYANFIKELLGFTRLSIMAELVYPNTNPYLTVGNKLQHFYGEYLLA